MRITVHIVDAFVHGEQGGNAAGVVLNAEHLSAAQKLKIAQTVGLSETAFVSQSRKASLKVEFFTPTRQIPHCGHATVAAFSLCRQLGYLSEGDHRKESIDGVLPLTITSDQVTLHQKFPTFIPLELKSAMTSLVLKSMGLELDSVRHDHQLTIARSGNGFLLIPLQSEATLAKLQPDYHAIALICEELDLIGYYPFSMFLGSERLTVSTRMFAPRYGIDEESATGTAAGPLGAYLLSHSKGYRDCSIEQGHFMSPPSPSLLQVAIGINNQDTVHQVHVTGVGRARTAMQVETE